MMGELALRYPPHSLVVSTGQYEGAAESDARFPQTIDRVGIRADRLRTLNGLALWTWRAAALAGRRRPGFVWCSEIKPAGYPARGLAARYGVPVGMFLYGTELLLLEEKAHEAAWKRATARMLCSRVATFVAISAWTADVARKLLTELDLPEAAARVRVVHLGTDPSQFRPGLDVATVRRRYGLEESGPWLLTVSRLEWHKGIDTMIRALPAILASHPGARYAIAGEGPRREHFERMVTDAGLESAVRFLGHVPDHELPAVYNAAALYVGASRRHDLMAEGFGISLVEASACGLAVVGGRSGGVPDAVRENETGVLVDPDDPAAVAASVNALLADPERRARLGAAGRTAVERYYNWDRFVREVREIELEIRGAASSPPLLRRPPEAPERAAR
jgi:phosphatidylinositol alpha-1,6-mannosyltransferase